MFISWSVYGFERGRRGVYDVIQESTLHTIGPGGLKWQCESISYNCTNDYAIQVHHYDSPVSGKAIQKLIHHTYNSDNQMDVCKPFLRPVHQQNINIPE